MSHDPADTLSWADRIIVLKDGRLLQQGPPQKIYHKPVDEYVAGLFGKYFVLDPQVLSNFIRKDNVSKKKLFVRAENFSIVKNKIRTMPGKVVDVIFFGDHYEIAIALKEVSIIVISREGNYTVGKKVNVALSVDNIL